MKFKRSEHREVSLDMTSLIDVVFLLLIFFMVATTFTRESHLKVDLPEANGEASVANVEQIDVVINAQGSISVNNQALAANDENTLRSAIAQTAKGNTDLPFVITADANTAHQYVVRAMDVAGKLGFSKLSITTQNAPTQ